MPSLKVRLKELFTILFIRLTVSVQDWQDINLKWNKSDYGEIGDIRIPPKFLWKPDLLMYNRLGHISTPTV